MEIIIKKPDSTKALNLKRVAAYARVSALDGATEHSLNQQTSYYTDLIHKRSEWAFVCVYADEGISGTLDARPGFQKMLADARSHKFDMLITKSVTRLARNAVTLLKVVRELKDLGIDVFFEKEEIHSISADGELMLTLLAMYAEEEARSASENKRWQIQRDFEKGRPTYARLLGYRWQDGQLKVIPEEAELVKRIFRLYLEGKGAQSIARIMRKEQAEANRQWPASAVHKILRNEKYKGDLLLQKTYIPDFRNKKQCMNRGQWTRFYIEDAHEAIIPKTVFQDVQDEISRRSKNYMPKINHGKSLFKGILKCHCCGSCYKRRCSSYDKNKYYWLCIGYLIKGKDYCQSKQIRETILIQKTKEVLGMDENAQLTRQILEKEIDKIEAMKDNKLRFFLKTGKVMTVVWENPSRSISWTPEMREAARQRALSQAKK